MKKIILTIFILFIFYLTYQIINVYKNTNQQSTITTKKPQNVKNTHKQNKLFLKLYKQNLLCGP